MRAIAVATAVVWIALPGPAQGADVQVSLGGGVEWDNNINRTDRDEEDDFVFQVRPKLRFVEDEGNVTWNLYYAPTYEKAVDEDRVDDFRHYLNGRASYHLDDNTEFFVRDRFTLSDAINTVTILDEGG
ncbi:MAG: hypothetical protein JRG84_18860, partial [Deltaproteobacteria bacterium]|nr:hypothetical protein [Deltaproteobacteria bacterium]